MKIKDALSEAFKISCHTMITLANYAELQQNLLFMSAVILMFML